MPGLVGLAEKTKTGISIGNAVASLCHDERFSSREFGVFGNLILSAVERVGAPVIATDSRESDVFVAFYGSIWTNKPQRHSLSVEELRGCYQENGIGSLFDLDGAFILVIVDTKRSNLYLLNDKLGEMSLQYANTDSAFAFAPEAKALFRMLFLKPKLSLDGVLAFLNIGYPLGSDTMFEGVQLLEPACCLTLDLKTLDFTVKRYWDIKYTPDYKLSRDRAVDELYGALIESFRTLPEDYGDRLNLLMTGGYDSRGALGMMTTTGNLPKQAITWGIDGNIPHSDPWTAREVCNLLQVPYRFMTYAAEGLLTHSRKWCYISELSSDNLGNFAAGARYFENIVSDEEFVIINDEPFGAGGYSDNLDGAIDYIFRAQSNIFNPPINAIFDTKHILALQDRWRYLTTRSLYAQPNDNPKDVQDYLYLRSNTVRWLFATAYFREPWVKVLRPLLQRPVLDVMLRFPPTFRVDKTVYIRMLQKKYPQLMRIPKSTVDSLVDWQYEVRIKPLLRKWSLDLLSWDNVKGTIMGEFLKSGSYQEFVGDYFAQEPIQISREFTSKSKLYALRAVLNSSKLTARAARAIQPLVKRVTAWKGSDNVTRVVFRIAQISMLQEFIDSGAFGTNS